MPASLKLQEQFGDDLQVIFVESQGNTVKAAEGFGLARKWLGGHAMWTTERPFETGSNGLPNFCLLGNDGKVLLKGNPLDQPKEIERQITEQIKNRKSAPADIHKAVRPAWSEYGKGKTAKALEILKTLANDANAKPEVVEAAKAADTEIRGRVAKDLLRVQWMIQNGFVEEASARVDEIKKAVKGDGDLEKSCAEYVGKLEAPDMKSEREAAKLLARLSTKFYQSGGDAAAAKELLSFAEKNKGTKAAERAEHIAKLPKS